MSDEEEKQMEEDVKGQTSTGTTTQDEKEQGEIVEGETANSPIESSSNDDGQNEQEEPGGVDSLIEPTLSHTDEITMDDSMRDFQELNVIDNSERMWNKLTSLEEKLIEQDNKLENIIINQNIENEISTIKNNLDVFMTTYKLREKLSNEGLDGAMSTINTEILQRTNTIISALINVQRTLGSTNKNKNKDY